FLEIGTPPTGNHKHFTSFALPAVRVRFPACLFCQGRPLLSRKRKLRGLDSAGGKAPGTATKCICFFFSSGNHARKKEERGKQNDRKTTRYLGRTTAGCGGKTGAHARSLHSLLQLLLRERLACAGTVHAAQPATRSTQYLSRLVGTQAPSPQRRTGHH